MKRAVVERRSQAGYHGIAEWWNGMAPQVGRNSFWCESGAVVQNRSVRCQQAATQGMRAYRRKPPVFRN